MKTLIKNGVVLTGNDTIEKGCVVVEDGIISSVNEMTDDYDQVIDAEGNYIVPAFIDAHTHGSVGIDFNTCQPEDIKKVAEYYRSEGVTGFLATLVPEFHEDLVRIFSNLHKCDVKAMDGVYIEGPFLSIEKKAVMKEECLCPVDIDKFREYKKVCPEFIGMTVAPELDGALELIEYGSKNGVVMNIGHSNATCKEALAGEKAGATGVTHLYNAMSQHLHREPGIVTAAMISSLYCELISDGIHIDKDVIRATYKAIGPERLILVSDANPFKGVEKGDYFFSGKTVTVTDEKVAVKETGRLAGSVLRLPKACQNMMDWCNATVEECVRMCSVNPADLYHLNKGHIKAGYQGDILIIDDRCNPIHLLSEDTIWY